MGRGQRSAGGPSSQLPVRRTLLKIGPRSHAPAPWKPSKEELADAHGKTIRDVIADDLDVLFSGINPGLYSGAVGHHFARPGNRFWPALHRAGFTPRLIGPFEERELLAFGLGVTNIVPRTTTRADELSDDELRRGAAALKRKVSRTQPKWLALLGLGAYRIGFGDAKAAVGPQDVTIKATRVWLLPNPSGLNAHYQLNDLTRAFAALRTAARG